MYSDFWMVYNEQTCNKSYDDEERNTQDAVFDLDNCLQERSSRDDNENDYNLGKNAKNVSQSSIIRNQCSLNGSDTYNNLDHSFQCTILSHLKGMK